MATDLQNLQIPEMQVVKQKYPQYREFNDVTLLNTISRKYPVYKGIADRVGGEITSGLKDGSLKQPEPEVVHEPSVFSTAVRSLVANNGINKLNTDIYRMKLLQQYPQGKDETNNSYQARVGSQIDQAMLDREKNIARGGTLPQLGDAITLGIGGGLLSAPVATAKALAAFSALESGANVVGLNKSIDQIKDPNLKDAASIAKAALFGAVSGGAASVKASDLITDKSFHPVILSNALKAIDTIAPTPDLAMSAKKTLVAVTAHATDKPLEEVLKSVQPTSTDVSNIEPFKKAGTAKDQGKGVEQGKVEQSAVAGLEGSVGKNKNTTAVSGMDKVDRLALVKARANSPYNVVVNLPDGSQKSLQMPLTKLMELKDNIKSGDSKIEIVSADKFIPPEVKVSAPSKAQESAKVIPEAQKQESFPNPKPSGLALSVQENAVAKNLTKGFENLPDYGSINIPEQAKASTLLVNRDPELTKNIIAGKAEPPSGIKKFSVFNAAETKAISEGDVNTLRDLATSPLNRESSEAAQTLRILAERNPESPVSAMKDLKSTREKAITERLPEKNLAKARETEVSKIKESISKVKSDKLTWNNFVESIKC